MSGNGRIVATEDSYKNGIRQQWRRW